MFRVSNNLFYKKVPVSIIHLQGPNILLKNTNLFYYGIFSFYYQVINAFRK
jgi:hypothetical protein